MVVGGGAAGCYAALNLHRQGIKSRHRLQGPGRQERRLDLRRQPGALGPRARQHRGAGAQHRRVPHQVSQPVPDRSALGARAAASGSRTSTIPSSRRRASICGATTQGNVVTSPGKIRSVAANMQGNSGVPFMDLRRKQVIKAGIPRLEETAVTALLRRPDGSVCGVFALNVMTGEYSGRARAAPSSWRPDIPTGCTRARPARARCRATASPWRGASARRWPTSKCSGGTPTTSPIRRPGSACRSIPTRCSARRSRRAWSIRRARSSSTSSRTIRSPMGPTPSSSRRWREQVHAGKARYDGGYYAGFDHCDPREVEAYTSYGKGFRQLGLRFPAGHGRGRRHRALPAGRHRRRHQRPCGRRCPGLYVAGGLGGHSNGLIGLATYDGKVVADGVAAELAAARSPARCRKPRCEREAQRLEALLASRRDGVPVAQVKERHPHDDVGQGRRREGRGEPAVRARRTSRTSGSTCCRA